MAADPRLAFCNPGRLVINPTALGMVGAFPHGGTELGQVGEVDILETAEETWIFAEETGDPVGKVVGYQTWDFAFSMLEWNQTALADWFRVSTTSAGSYTSPAPKVIQRRLAGRQAASSPLLFVPRDPEGIAAIIYSPMPFIPQERKWVNSFKDGLETAIWLRALAPVGKEPIRMDRIEHLSVTG